MPSWTQTLSQQNQGASAGKLFFPSSFSSVQYNYIGDSFNRETLQPSNSYTLYTLNTVGTGAATLSGAATLDLTTSNTAADSLDLRTSGFTFDRIFNFNAIDAKSILNFDLIFQNNSTSNVKGFIGFLDPVTTSITAIPTTTAHLGVYWDTSVNNDLWLSSADGSTQTKTDSLSTLSATSKRLNINQTGKDSATINLYDSTFNTLLKSQTVSAYGTNGSKLHIYIETITGARNMRVLEWGCQIL